MANQTISVNNGPLTPIDRKFRFIGFNATSGKLYTEDNAMLFAAKDRALVPTLKFYREECTRLRCSPEHISGINLLIDRVECFQRETQNKVPDLGAVEAVRVIHGIISRELPRQGT